MNITAGKYKGRVIFAPDEKITRPTLSKTRMGIFNTLYSIMGDFTDKSFLDVFGGSGIMGLEALSRGFAKTKVFELNKKAAAIIKKNYSLLGLVPDLTLGDSVKLIKNLDECFDVAYIDPPYNSHIYEDVLKDVNAKIIITESSANIEYQNLTLLKQKTYGNCIVTFLSK